MKILLDKKTILELFNALNQKLHKENVQGELYLVGGAVMCLNFNTRPSTLDIDGYYAPKTKIKEAAQKVAEEFNINTDWLNDAVKGFLSPHGNFSEYLELSHLKIFCAHPEYLLAMKCLCMRLGKEFHDESDIRYLLRYLNITKSEDALKIIEKYYDQKLIPQKTFYALEELLS